MGISTDPVDTGGGPSEQCERCGRPMDDFRSGVGVRTPKSGDSGTKVEAPWPPLWPPTYTDEPTNG